MPSNSTGSANESKPERMKSKRIGSSRVTDLQSGKESDPVALGQYNRITHALVTIPLKTDSIVNRQVQVMSTLPLKAAARSGAVPMSWIYLRVPGFRWYTWILGVKSNCDLFKTHLYPLGASLTEASESDLHVYPNLTSFYRALKPGVRPLDSN